MLDKKLIPQQNPQINQYLTNLYNQAGAASHSNALIDKKIGKIDNSLKEKIVHTVAISQYFDNLWKQSDLKEYHKEYVIKKLEAIHQIRKLEIKDGSQRIAKSRGDLDIINAKFKAAPFEIHIHQEKLKNIKKKNNLDLESELFTNKARDLEVLYGLNRQNKLNGDDSGYLHYTAGLYEVVDESDILKKIKAEEFVKKVQEEKKAFNRKIKLIEENVENREHEEFERLKKQRQEEEEKRLKEKKKRLESHIQQLKVKSEARIKENAKWEEDYKVYLNKKPLFKEFESKFEKGYLVPELEERKKKLQDIRNFHKPIDRQEFLEHEQKVTKILEQRQKEKKEQLENSNWVYKKPDYESRHHKAYAEELNKVRNSKEESQQMLIKRKEKVMDLLQDVKDRHLPRVDPQKEMEMIGLIEKLKSKKDNRSRTADEDYREHGRKLGDEYLKNLRILVKKMKKDNPNSSSRDVDYSTNGRKSESYISTDKRNVIQSTKSEANLRKHNYLADLRKENKLHSSTSQIDLIIKNKKLDAKERNMLLHSEIQKLEEKAKRKEMVKKYKIKNVEGAVSDDDEVDRIYINAIRAKLEMLGH